MMAATFKSWLSYFYFERSIKKAARFIYDSDTRDFLETILDTGQSRIKKIKAGSKLWRSQLDHEWRTFDNNGQEIEERVPYDKDRMKPPPESAKEGRVNPSGIPCLYLSDHRETAMAEVRPWIGQYISLAQFKVVNELRIIDCSSDKQNLLPDSLPEQPSPEEREIAVWHDINEVFSKPVIADESSVDYIPTQVISELFKNNGLNGIAYRSSLGKGRNIALFELDMAEWINPSTLWETKNICFDFSKGR